MDDTINLEILNESIEEVRTTYKCDICLYESAYKQNSTRHVKSARVSALC